MATSRQPQQADLIVKGKIWTGNQAQPYAEAMAVMADTIVAIGTAAAIATWKGDHTQEITTEPGQLIVPGLIDAHTHFMNAGFKLSSVQLRDAQTPEEFIQRIADYAKKLKPGTWMLGGEWDHKNWGDELPHRDWIDAVTPDNPVWIERLDLHMALANTAALRAAGITDAVEDVKGGAIIRKNGKLTGIFKDNAKDLIAAAIPMPTTAQEDAALQAAMNHVAARGITSVHNMMGIGPRYYEVYQRARDQGKLTTRIYLSEELQKWQLLADDIRESGRGDQWLRIGILKAFVDGSLGSHTAAFLEPFTDAPNDTGMFVTPKENLYQTVKAADHAGLQVTIHAIGDRAIRTLLDIYQQVAEENGPRDRRFRMEHAQHVHPNDMSRFAEIGVIASMQPYHAIDDGRWAEQVVGTERAKTTFAIRSLLDAQTKIAFGSDWPVAPISPLEGIDAAVNRRTLDGKNPDGWIPDQKISVEEALRAYTIDAAFASFEEDVKGSLEKGKLADFVILGEDITIINPAGIKDVAVLQTFVGGKKVYESETVAIKH